MLEPRERRVEVAVRAAAVQHDPPLTPVAEELQHARVVVELSARCLEHRFRLRVQHGVLPGMHRQAHPLLARECPHAREVLGQRLAPHAAVH